jgi:hypothetical protein
VCYVFLFQCLFLENSTKKKRVTIQKEGLQELGRSIDMFCLTFFFFQVSVSQIWVAAGEPNLSGGVTQSLIFSTNQAVSWGNCSRFLQNGGLDRRKGIAYSQEEGQFIAISSRGPVIRSNDGIIWEDAVPGFMFSGNGANGGFQVVWESAVRTWAITGRDPSANNCIRMSKDGGQTWRTANNLDTLQDFQDARNMGWGPVGGEGGTWVACLTFSSAARTGLYYSLDGGLNFAESSGDGMGVPEAVQYSYFHNLFIAVGSNSSRGVAHQQME